MTIASRIHTLRSQTERLSRVTQPDPIRSDRIQRVRRLADALYAQLSADDPQYWGPIVCAVNYADATTLAAELSAFTNEAY